MKAETRSDLLRTCYRTTNLTYSRAQNGADFALFTHCHGAATGAKKLEHTQPRWIAQRLENDRFVFVVHDHILSYISRNIELFFFSRTVDLSIERIVRPGSQTLRCDGEIRMEDMDWRGSVDDHYLRLILHSNYQQTASEDCDNYRSGRREPKALSKFLGFVVVAVCEGLSRFGIRDPYCFAATPTKGENCLGCIRCLPVCFER